MGPKKEVAEKEKVRAVHSLEDPINSDVWRCVVVMAIERSSSDSFILKEFMTEANKGRRQEVKLINFNSFVIKILNDFASGKLSFKYVFLLNFSSVFQEAAEFVKSKMDIPVPLLVKVVKALLFFLKDESIQNIEKKSLGPPDPIRTMAERPGNIEDITDNKTKSHFQKIDQATAGKTKKADSVVDNGIKIKPLSTTKEETELSKRDEGTKEYQHIDDAPLNGFFNLYVLLTGFYHPDFPLELIKAGIPLHGLLCIDTSLSGGVRLAQPTPSRSRKLETIPEPVQNFWDSFLKILWHPQLNFYFKDVIFQIYTPQKLSSNKTKLREFIYKELSYLMYDMSDFKRQHNHYLNHMKLWNVDIKESYKIEENEELISFIDKLPSECVTVPVVIQYMLDVICFEEEKHLYGPKSVSYDSIDTSESTSSGLFFSSSVLVKYSSSVMTPDWSNIIIERGDLNSLNVYTKAKELDAKYGINDRSNWFETCSGKNHSEKNESQSQVCSQRKIAFTQNLDEALNPESSMFKSFWKNIPEQNSSLCLDYCVYSLLMTKVFCSYQIRVPVSFKDPPPQSNLYSKKRSTFEVIEKVEREMRNPHFTVTNCSRNVLKYIPYNVKEINRDFFCPSELKIVTPEKLKAISAPEFHKAPPLEHQISFPSDFTIPSEFLRNLQFNVFENLGSFLGEDMFLAVNGFDFVEELSKSKLLTKEENLQDDYNCTDHFHFALTDSLFVVFHNRKDSDNTYHETFNETIRSPVGLRDFFEYILEDESLWLATQEEIYQSKVSQVGKISEENTDLKNYSDSYFWMDTSIKYQEFLKLASSSVKEVRESREITKVDNEKESKEAKKVGNSSKPVKKNSAEDSNEFVSLPTSEPVNSEESYAFEGYNISDVAVQYSGLKTVYQARDCSIAVELIERLYGSQHLGIHIRQGGHTLHLYSYVCPEPHLIDPYTCHLFYKNGIVVAFGKRFIETFEEIEEEEIVESKTVLNKVKRNSSELSTAKKTKRVKKVCKRLEDDEFSYDMRLSMPNGLTVAVVREIVEPCYIKQWYLTKSYSSSEKTLGENKRLFLPNGHVVKIMNDGTVEILRVDTSIITSSLDHLVNILSTNNTEENLTKTEDYGALSFTKYEITTSEGFVHFIDEGKVMSSRKLQVFINKDVESNTTFYRRVDGTNYLMQNDGTLCVQFKDGTKISNSVLVKEKENFKNLENQEEGFDEEVEEKDDVECEFAFIYNEVIMEHPDYATLIYNSYTKDWKIMLPFDSTIKVESKGNYEVDIDSRTKLKIDGNLICMDRFSTEHEVQCQTIADLTVFKNVEKEIYCLMKDSSGKTFVIEPNSNCYVLNPEEIKEDTKDIENETLQASAGSSSQSQLVALEDLTSCESTETTRKDDRRQRNKLSPENKYFVVRRDLTGFELLHREHVKSALDDIKTDSVIYTQEIPDSGNLRCFILIGPVPENKHRGGNKWEVQSILPEPKFVSKGSEAMTSSLYGHSPTWMHPFPKKRKKNKIPEELTCRVFIETKRSDFSPELGSFDFLCSEMDDLPEIKHSKIEPGLRNVLNYMKRLSSDDQDLLKEIYALAVKQMLMKKKLKRPVNTDKLKNYLALSKQCMELQDYHKRSIRYHEVPNYFDHPAGICWLWLNDLLKVTESKDENQTMAPVLSSSSSASTSVFSNEEIEYNLDVSGKLSYSDLSCRTDISVLTAPTILTREEVFTSKIKLVRGAESAPETKILTSVISEQDIRGNHQGFCAFEENEIERLEKAIDDLHKGVPPMKIGDLICLGLV